MMALPDFRIDQNDFRLQALPQERLTALQDLLERCADFNELVEGEPVAPDAALEVFEALPPGVLPADKFVFGLFDRSGGLHGVLEGVRGYPEAGVWWIGLLLLDPASRGQGLGQRVVQGFCDWVRAQQGHAVMLGVVEANTAGARFWQRQGFIAVRQTEPRPFGRKVQVVHVLRRDLLAGDHFTTTGR
jgi:GNAT superfamily N-acetyltransferase